MIRNLPPKQDPERALEPAEVKPVYDLVEELLADVEPVVTTMGNNLELSPEGLSEQYPEIESLFPGTSEALLIEEAQKEVLYQSATEFVEIRQTVDLYQARTFIRLIALNRELSDGAKIISDVTDLVIDADGHDEVVSFMYSFRQTAVERGLIGVQNANAVDRMAERLAGNWQEPAKERRAERLAADLMLKGLEPKLTNGELKGILDKLEHLNPEDRSIIIGRKT